MLTGLVDNVIERHYGPFMAKVRLALQLRREHFAFAVLFSMSPETSILAMLANPKAKVGFRGYRLNYRANKITRRPYQTICD